MIGVDRRPVQVLGATPELMITLGPTNKHRKLKAKFLVIRMKGTSSSIILGRTTISYYRMLIDLYNNRIYLPPDPDDAMETQGNGEDQHADCLPPREECYVMDETGSEAIMLYLEQEAIIPANTMRVCKVTSRNLRAHEGRLFWLRSMTNEIKLVAAQAMAPVDKGALWIPIYNAEDMERTISTETHVATAERVIIMAPEVMRRLLNHETSHRGESKQKHQSAGAAAAHGSRGRGVQSR